MNSILVIEDDAALRSAVANILEEHGFDVATAANGMDALLALSRGARPSVIVLDLMMPTLSGWEFLNELRAHPQLSDTPVLVATAFNAPPAGVRVDGFLRKPFEPDALVQLVRRLASLPPIAV
jgi:CheY-like chemotaxis protein